MVDCWLENPDDRPSFELLHEETTGLLQEEVKKNINEKGFSARIQVFCQSCVKTSERKVYFWHWGAYIHI